MGVAFNNNLAVLADHHQPASGRLVSARRDVHGPRQPGPVRPRHQVERGRRRPRSDPGTDAHGVSRGARPAGPGPVHLDIPHDVLAAEVDFADVEFDVEPSRTRAIDGPRPNREGVARGAALLAAARRPVIVAGGGVVLSGAEGEVRELAALLACAGRPDADGARRDRDRKSLLRRSRWTDRRSGGARRHRAGRRRAERRMQVLQLGVGRGRSRWFERTHQHININIDPSALGAPALHDVGLQADAREASAGSHRGAPADRTSRSTTGGCPRSATFA